jgi:hypothetical protein
MKRPQRSVRRESQITVPGSRSKSYPEGRPVVLVLPPTADVLIVREKGRRVAYEVDVLSVYHLGARLAAAAVVAKRRAKKEGKR